MWNILIRYAHIRIKRVPEMERVALCPIIPNFDCKPRLLLDVGANVELKKEHFPLDFNKISFAFGFSYSF